MIRDLAKGDVADQVLESIGGQLSRRMLEHCSHITIDAMRHAVDLLDAARRSTPRNGYGHGSKRNGAGPDAGDSDALVR